MSAGRVIAVVFGSLILLVGIALLIGGGAIVGVDRAFTDADGFLTAPSGDLQRDSYALVGEVVLEGDWIWWWKEPTAAQVRMTSEQPVFIGIAARPDVEAYLSDVSYSQIDDIDFDEYRRDRVWKTDFRDSVGPDAPALPGEQAFWRASIEGEGSQTLRWELEPGDWMLVVMNVDGSRGVAAEGTVGVQAPWLLGVGIGVLAAGVLLIAIGLVFILLVARGARTASPGEPAEAQPITPGVFPLSFKAEKDAQLSPALWFVKWFLLIPHFIVLAFLYVGFCFSWLFSLIAILFTGRYPRSLFDYNVGVMRWSWRVAFYGYEALGTDRYPPFTLQSGGYPADLDVPYPEKLSRGLVLVKWWLLAIPHYIVVGIFQGGAGFEQVGLVFILTIFAGVSLLFTGRYPRELFQLIVGINRWTFRLFAYVALMTDKYPPFRLEE